MGILDIPDDTLLAIAAIIKADYTYPRVLSNLSQVSKRLNAVCGTFIFREYRLEIRSDSYKPSLLGKYRYSEPGDLSIDLPLLMSHARSKSAYIRQLTIVDIGPRNRDVSKETDQAFDAEIMAQIYILLEAIPGLTALHLRTSESRTQTCDFPVALWSIMQARRLRSISILGSFVIPNGLSDPISVEKLQLTYFTGTARLLELVSTSKLVLNYPYGLSEPLPFSATDPNLSSIVIDFAPERSFKKSLFDFSRVPQASISVKIPFDVEYKMHIPNAWIRLKSLARVLFKEGLDGYDVYRTNSGICIDRPSSTTDPSWKPTRFAHLEGEQAERKEAQQMQAYYKMRARQQLRF